MNEVIPTLNILHISDFHCTSPPSPFHARIIEELLSNLAEAKVAGRSIELVVFTGDLTKSGAEDEFMAAVDCLLEPVAKFTGLPHDRILVAAGNHDVCWEDIDPYAERGLVELLEDNEAVEKLLGDERRLKRAVERMNNFLSFEAMWYGDENPPTKSPPLARLTRIEVGQKRVGIAVLNSTWRSTDQRDKDKLLIGELQIASCLQSLADTEFRIVAFHHPLDWLRENDTRVVQHWLQRSAHLVLTGHTHISEPSFRITPAGSTTYSGSGCLYESSEYQNAYSVLKVGLNEETYSVDLVVHPYSPETGFSEVSDSSSNAGLRVERIPFAASSIALAEALPTPAVIGRHLAQLAESHSVIPQHIARKNPSRVSEIFVSPIFLPMPYAQLARELGGKDYEKHHMDVHKMLTEKNCLAICGDSESGLTGSLLWILDECLSARSQAIPIYVDSSELIAGPSLVDRGVRHALVDLGVSLPRRDDLPPLVIGIDNAHRLKGRQLEHISKFHLNNPQHTLLLGWHDERLRVSDQLTRLSVDHNICYLGPLGVPELRSIVKKLAPEASSEVVNLVLKILKTENLPRTPYVMTLLAILVSEGSTQLDGLSESILLDKYVTHLLELAAGAENSRIGLDPENWSRILEYVAEQFRIGGTRSRSRIEVDGFVMEYLRSLTWGDTVFPIVEQLLEWRLLAQRGEKVSFWHPALSDIFLGRRINSEFRTASAEQPESYTERALGSPLQHSRPIEHAAALAKGNRVILERIAEFDNEIFTSRGRELSAGHLPNVVLKSGWADSEDLEGLVNQVKYEIPSAEERDRLQVESWQQFEAAHVDDVPPEDFGDNEELGLLDELASTVRLFSSVLRSSEHLADAAALKKSLLTRAIEQWAGVALLMLVEEDVYQTSTEFVKELFVSDRLQRNLSDEDLTAFVDRLIHLLFVVFISIDMNESLGTRKMNELLAELLEDSIFFEHPSRALFGTLLYSELESGFGSKWLDFFEQLFKRYRRYLVVLDILTVSLQRRYYYGPIREQDRSRLAALIAEVTLDVNGVQDQEQRMRAKSQLITGLQQHHLNLNRGSE